MASIRVVHLNSQRLYRLRAFFPRTIYGNSLRYFNEIKYAQHGPTDIVCTLVQGSGIGPEMLQSVEAVFKAGKFPVKFDTVLRCDWHSQVETIVRTVRKNGICISGVLKTNVQGSGRILHSERVAVRRNLDLYANVVHCKGIPGVKCRHPNTDLVIIREQTEGEYSSMEHEGVKGVIESLKIITLAKSMRIAKFAFDYATAAKRKKVTAIHKANIMKLTDGLFLKCCVEMSKLYPRIKFESMIVDNCTMQVVSKPEQFDVLVTPNLYGNILDNLVTGLVGGAGVVPGVSYAPDCAVFEPGARHTFSTAAGKNIANPTCMLLAAVMMLKHINCVRESKILYDAIIAVLQSGKYYTADLGGKTTTEEFTNAVIDHLKI